MAMSLNFMYLKVHTVNTDINVFTVVFKYSMHLTFINILGIR